MLSLETFKTRRCSTCTEKDKKKFGCEEDIKPFNFDGTKLTRCPLVPFKENPRAYSEIFQLYAFREKNVMAEQGGFFDQPAVYIELMSEMDSAVTDSMDTKRRAEVPVSEDEDKKLAGLKSLGIPIVKK